MAAPIPDTPESTSKVTEEESEEKHATRFKDIWKIKPCSFYSMVHKDCIGWKTKYYHRYWDGMLYVDCDLMKTDVEMCEELAEHESLEAYEHLLKMEEAKRQKRLDSIQNNNVWEYRTSPPMGWYTNKLNNSPATVGLVEGVPPTCKEHNEPFLSRNLERYSANSGDQDLRYVKPKLWLKPLRESVWDKTSKCVIS